MHKHQSAQRTELAEYQLAARVIGAATDAGARTILLVSARAGEGKTQLTDCIVRHAASITRVPVRVARLQPGDGLLSAAPEGPGMLWIDGLSLLEGRGCLQLTADVRASLDAALLVARALRTPRDDLKQCAEMLSALGLRTLGAVWNEDQRRPPQASLVARLLLRGAQRARPPYAPASQGAP